MTLPLMLNAGPSELPLFSYAHEETGNHPRHPDMAVHRNAEETGTALVFANCQQRASVFCCVRRSVWAPSLGISRATPRNKIREAFLSGSFAPSIGLSFAPQQTASLFGGGDEGSAAMRNLYYLVSAAAVAIMVAAFAVPASAQPFSEMMGSRGYGGYGAFHLVIWVLILIAIVFGVVWRVWTAKRGTPKQPPKEQATKSGPPSECHSRSSTPSSRSLRWRASSAPGMAQDRGV